MLSIKELYWRCAPPLYPKRDSKLTPFKNNDIEEKFNSYPDGIKQKLLKLRELIYEVALEEKSVTDIEETLKWGEPSYVTKIEIIGTIKLQTFAGTPEYQSVKHGDKAETYFFIESNKKICFTPDGECLTSQVELSSVQLVLNQKK